MPSTTEPGIAGAKIWVTTTGRHTRGVYPDGGELVANALNVKHEGGF